MTLKRVKLEDEQAKHGSLPGPLAELRAACQPPLMPLPLHSPWDCGQTTSKHTVVLASTLHNGPRTRAAHSKGSC